MLTLLAFGLRIYRLDHEPLHVDELKQVREVQSPVGEIIELSYRHQQPPLDYLIGKAIVEVAPATDFTQRLPAAIFGGLAVGLVVLIFARVNMWIGAIAAGVLAAVHPFLVEYSQYARPYALPLFLVTASIAVYQHWQLGNRTRLTKALFAVTAFLALISRALMPLISLALLGLGATLTSLVAKRTNLREAIRNDPLALVILPIEAVLIWFPSFLILRHFGGGHLVQSGYDLPARLALTVERIHEFGQAALEPLPAVWLLSTAIVLTIVPQVRQVLARTWYLWLPLLATGPVFALAHSLTTREGQFFADRYMVFLPLGLAALIGVIAQALFELAKTQSRSAVVAAILLGGLLYGGHLALPAIAATQEMYERVVTADWRSVGHHLSAIGRDGDVIIAIDTRTFRRNAFNFGFEAKPRYYSGDLPSPRPDDVALNPNSPAATASRYHFVLFVPRLSNEAELPAEWSITEYQSLTIITTNVLSSDFEREWAWWTVAEYLRGDVSVMTRIAGYALAESWFPGSHPHPWKASAIQEAKKLGLEQLAREWLARIETLEEASEGWNVPNPLLYSSAKTPRTLTG